MGNDRLRPLFRLRRSPVALLARPVSSVSFKRPVAKSISTQRSDANSAMRNPVQARAVMMSVSHRRGLAGATVLNHGLDLHATVAVGRFAFCLAQPKLDRVHL